MTATYSGPIRAIATSRFGHTRYTARIPRLSKEEGSERTIGVGISPVLLDHGSAGAPEQAISPRGHRNFITDLTRNAHVQGNPSLSAIDAHVQEKPILERGQRARSGQPILEHGNAHVQEKPILEYGPGLLRRSNPDKTRRGQQSPRGREKQQASGSWSDPPENARTGPGHGKCGNTQRERRVTHAPPLEEIQTATVPSSHSNERAHPDGQPANEAQDVNAVAEQRSQDPGLCTPVIRPGADTSNRQTGRAANTGSGSLHPGNSPWRRYQPAVT